MSANLVSPMVVVIVALTALGDFAIPSEELSEGIRLVKYAMLFLCAGLGIMGFFLGLVFLLIHLANLKSFGVSYLAPYSALGAQPGSGPEGQSAPLSIDFPEAAAGVCTEQAGGCGPERGE
ncbi:MAG: spore germination protein [Blautia sp.]